MNVDRIREQIAACRSRSEMIDWVGRSKDLQVVGKLTRQIAKDVVREVGEHLRRNRRGEAAASALAYALVDGDGLVAELRRAGVLRASRYQFRTGGPQELVAVLLSLKDALKLSPTSVQYLQSLIALYDMAAEVRKTREALVRRMTSRRGKALKSFLVMANQVFATKWAHDRHLPSNDLRHYSAEDISDGVSRLLVIHRESLGMRREDWQYTDAQAINPLNATYGQDLLDALRLNEFMKAETLVDGLPYRAVLHPDGVVVESIDPDLERSVRLGYVQMDVQVILRHQMMEQEWKQGGAPLSFDAVCEYVKEGLQHFVVYKSKPLPRIAFHIPNDPRFFEFTASDRYFKEDLLSLLQLSVQGYDDPTLEPFEVAPGITSIDLFKVNRLFRLVSYAMQLGLQGIEDPKERELLTLNSVIPFVSREDFITTLKGVLPDDKAERVFELLKFDGTRDFADLQYMPFIVVEGGVLVAPSLVANSNLVRNITIANRLNKDRIKDRDPMQCAVVEALRSAGFLVEEDVGLNREDHDVDVFAYRDGVLYAFECKNAYHPCNAHEMRNSYDYIDYAGQQLTFRQELLSDPANQAKLFSRLGWPIAPTSKIQTGILIANRIFTGVSINGHPVRQAHEFINVVSRGFIRASDGSELIFWDGDEVTTSDVNRYLGDNGLLADHFAAMSEVNNDYAIGRKTLRFRSWMFDLKRHHEIARKYRLRTPVPSASSEAEPDI
jgi:hypothetical protein